MFVQPMHFKTEVSAYLPIMDFAGLRPDVILGSIGFLCTVVWVQFIDVCGAHYLLVARTLGASLVGIVLWASLMGSMHPLVLKMIGSNPATSSAPFVATLVDVTGYFTMACFILRGTLL